MPPKENDRVVSRNQNGRPQINQRGALMEESKSSHTSTQIRTNKNARQPLAFGDNYGNSRMFAKPPP